MATSAPNTNELNSPVLETQPLAGDAALLHSSIADGYEEIIRAPFDYLLNLPGKDVRSKMISAFNQWLCIPADKLEVIKRIVMLLHNASLLDFVPLVNVLGVIFQIRDDYLNLQSHAYTVNKGFGEDLTEGKYSFPIIHSIRSDPTNIQLSSILKQRTTDVDVKLFAVECIKATGSFEHCKEKIAELVAEARQLIKEMGNSVPGSAEAVDRVLDLIGLEPESS
ncbi:Geranylgeranyl pyrophosphate synthase [Metarhizium anisopliae]